MNLLGTVLGALTPHLMEVIGLALTILLGGLFSTLKTRWGIEIEARHRAALHSAIMTGVLAALDRGLAGEAAVNAALGHVHASVPDAIEKLRPAPGVIDNLIGAALRETLDQSAIVRRGKKLVEASALSVASAALGPGRIAPAKPSSAD